MTRSKTQTTGLAGACAALTVLLAGCGLFSSGPGPTATSPGGASSPGTTISTRTATPSPTPQLVKSVTLVAALGAPKDWTPAGLTWAGIQKAGAGVGAATTLVEPASATELAADLERAAGTPGAVVVTVGPDADPSVQAAAAAHPTTQFLEMDVAVAASSPPNVHGLVFDEAEAGYLGGYVAASFATTAEVGFVGDTATDPSSANYGAGFAAGVAEAGKDLTVGLAYAGTADSPDKGRAAAATLVKAGSGVIMAPPSLSGIGAFREACTRGASLVAVAADAWQIVPDVQPCLIASVLKRYDTAVGSAIVAVAAGRTLAANAVGDVASGAIALSEFHAPLPDGFQAGLDAVMATLRAGPPRATPGPSMTAIASQSPKPSGT